VVVFTHRAKEPLSCDRVQEAGHRIAVEHEAPHEPWGQGARGGFRISPVLAMPQERPLLSHGDAVDRYALPLETLLT